MPSEQETADEPSVATEPTPTVTTSDRPTLNPAAARDSGDDLRRQADELRQADSTGSAQKPEPDPEHEPDPTEGMTPREAALYRARAKALYRRSEQERERAGEAERRRARGATAQRQPEMPRASEQEAADEPSVATEPTPTVQDVLAGGLGSGLERTARPTVGAASALRLSLAGAVELLPDDLQEDVAEIQRKPGGMLVRACRWLFVASVYVVASGALCYGVFQLYFGRGRLQCGGTVLDDKSRHALETLIGAAPIQLRSTLLGAAGVTLCRKVTGARGDGVGLGSALLTVPSAAGDEEIVGRAGWERIVGRSGAQTGPLFSPLLLTNHATVLHFSHHDRVHRWRRRGRGR
eukprot:COSAG06_NODE_1616_length_8924_cov_9.604419_5_plen_351_part_00